MAILARMFRLFRADIHGVMDQLEDQGLLLKQHLRDMEESLLQKETALNQMRFTRDQARQDYEKAKNDTETLEQDLKVAINKDRDNIARMLIKRLKPLTCIQSEFGSHIERLNHEIKQFKENIGQQRLQFDLLRQKAFEYFHRAEKQNWDNPYSYMQSDNRANELSAEEVELELLQRKESIT